MWSVRPLVAPVSRVEALRLWTASVTQRPLCSPASMCKTLLDFERLCWQKKAKQPLTELIHVFVTSWTWKQKSYRQVSDVIHYRFNFNVEKFVTFRGKKRRHFKIGSEYSQMAVVDLGFLERSANPKQGRRQPAKVAKTFMKMKTIVTGGGKRTSVKKINKLTDWTIQVILFTYVK